MEIPGAAAGANQIIGTRRSEVRQLYFMFM